MASFLKIITLIFIALACCSSYSYTAPLSQSVHAQVTKHHPHRHSTQSKYAWLERYRARLHLKQLAFNWTGHRTSVLDGAIFVMKFNSANSSVYVGTEAGNVWRYDGTVWTKLQDNTGTDFATIDEGNFITGIAFDDLNNLYVSSASKKVWQLNLAGGTWTNITNEETGIDDSMVDDLAWINGSLYAVTDFGLVWRYSGGTWVNLPGPLDDQSLDSSSVNTITYDNAFNLYVGTFIGNVWKYDGTSWGQLVGSAADTSLDSSPVWSLKLDAANNIYAATIAGNVWQYNALSSSWSQLIGESTAGSLDDSPVYALILSNSNVLYATTDLGNMWQYNNSGVWSLLAARTIFDSGAIWAITFDIAGNIYVATENAQVWEYVGGTWVPIS